MDKKESRNLSLDELGSNWIVAIGLYVGFLSAVSWYSNLTGDQQAMMTNTLAATTGVLLGLYFLVRVDWQSDMVGLFLASILLSLTSSLFSFGTPHNSSSKTIFVLSVGLFSATTLAFGTLVRTKQKAERPNPQPKPHSSLDCVYRTSFY